VHLARRGRHDLHLYFRFIQFRGFAHAIAVVRGDYSNPKRRGRGQPFQALTTASRARWASATSPASRWPWPSAGAGATFWMILAGLLGMASKFTEVHAGREVPGTKPRRRRLGRPDALPVQGLGERAGPAGPRLAVFFAVCCVGGRSAAATCSRPTRASQQVVNVTGGEASPLAGNGWLFGLIMAVLVGMVIIGGIKSIARVTEKVVPFMALIYMVAGLAVLIINADQMLWAFGQIVSGAFSAEGVAGGVVGVADPGLQARSVLQRGRHRLGGHRPLCGADRPAGEPGLRGTARALHRHRGHLHHDRAGHRHLRLASGLPWFPYILALAVILFAFSTMLTWSYYGVKSWTYLVGEGGPRRTSSRSSSASSS
jgi:alanine or glycine:cation symporter, AGCS family